MQWTQWLCLVTYLAAVGWALRTANFGLLRQNHKAQHLLFGCTTAVFLLWLFRVGIYPGLTVHFLWLSALPLILGLRWAIISSALVLLGITVFGLEPATMYGVNGLFGCLAPLLLSYAIYSFSFHHLPRHLFIYLFVCAFAAGALAIGFKMLLLSGYYYLTGQYDGQVIVDNYLILTPLLLFPEGMLNGMTMTLLIIYLPSWVSTFYDKHYLYNK